jgi:hypothetical protein
LNVKRDIQSDFDGLVAIAEAWLLCNGFSAEERALAAQIEEARRIDEGVADAAVQVAFSRVAPPGLEWNPS